MPSTPPRSTLFPYTTLFRSGGDRHVRGEHVPQLDDLPGLDELRRAHDGGRLHVVGGAALVAGAPLRGAPLVIGGRPPDRKSTRLNSSHVAISYAVFCLKKKI